jgi:hypothetical protein
MSTEPSSLEPTIPAESADFRDIAPRQESFA